MIIGGSPQLNGSKFLFTYPCIVGLDARWNRQLGIVVVTYSAAHNAKHSRCIRDDVLQREPEVTRQLWLCIARRQQTQRMGRKKEGGRKAGCPTIRETIYDGVSSQKRVDKLSAGCSSYVPRLLLSRPENITRRTSLSTIPAALEE